MICSNCGCSDMRVVSYGLRGSSYECFDCKEVIYVKDEED